MTIKKLTVAAAIAVGIATCSFNNAMAACPISGCNSCPSAVMPANVCPICGKDRAHCSCPAQAQCGCNSAPACGCNSCASDCGCNSCAPACDCAPCKPNIPACATCPNTSCNNMDMKQVYAYPDIVFGDNYYVGQQNNSIYSTYSAWDVDGCDRAPVAALGLPINGQIMGAACGCGCGTAAPCGCGCEQSSCCGAAAPCGCESLPVVTGFAAPSGCGCVNGLNDSHAAYDCTCSSGAVVSNGNKCCCGKPMSVTSFLTTPAENIGYGLTTGLDMLLSAPFNLISGNFGRPKGGCPISIQTCNSIDALKKSFVAVQASNTMAATPCGCCGAAAPLTNAFPDVPENYWAACPIDKLAMNDIVVGYPDKLFRPGKCVSRAEFATMMVKGFNLNCGGLQSKSLFKDVPRNNWANSLIAKAVEEGIMCGYPNRIFKPRQPVSRVEALTAMAHGINCDMSCDRAQQILSQYCDGSQVPSWAQIPVAKALDTGILKNSLNPNTIDPCKNASRAEIADMLQNVRVTIGYDKNPVTACDNCPKPAEPCCPKTSYMEQCETIQIPTLKVEFLDEINAKSTHAGQFFAAKTLEDITVNGKVYPCGSRVVGNVVEVIRPSGCKKGALKLAFTSIQGCDGCKVELPKQILCAKIECNKSPNFFAKLIAAPFTLAGTLVGTTARATGGIISNLGNAAERASNSTGIALGDVLQGSLGASVRSIADAGTAIVTAPVDAVGTAISGAIGLVQTTGDEVAYLLSPNGYCVSSVNPRERVTVAFGCSGP